MEGNDWWREFRKDSNAIGKLAKAVPVLAENLQVATRFFSWLNASEEKRAFVSPSEMVERVGKVEELLQEIRLLEENSSQEKSRSFYDKFAGAIESGLREARRQIPALRDSMAPESASSDALVSESGGDEMVEETPESMSKANRLGEELFKLRKQYVAIMEEQHQEKVANGLKETTADEADRLESFIEICDHWLKHLYALENSTRVLEENLADDRSPVVKDPLPLQFRLERNKPSHTVRLIRASYKHPTPEDVTVLDVINGCYKIPTFDRDGKLLIDEKDTIRFIRLHSEKDNLLHFKGDSLSGLASQMYDILVEIVQEIDRMFKGVIDLINRTPMQDLEHAFAGINPEECRSLLRQKFQAMLPGINEDHYHAGKNKAPQEHSVRTVEIAEEYERNFQKTKEAVLGGLKPTVATYYWLRKMLTMVIRNSRAQRKRQEVEDQANIDLSEKAEDRKKEDSMLVGTSLTIGDDDIANFYISPDDVISSEMSIQRADRADKWIAVRKSEKMHRLPKRDFFNIVQSFLETDLNAALKRFGFREVDLKNQLLPEIHERLGDEHRIELIRSGILGTTITNLEDFYENKEFHSTMRRYFQKPTYDNIHYPRREKLRLIATGLTYANTTILQMKYRKVLKVREEIDKKIKNLGLEIDEGVPESHEKSLQKQKKHALNLLKIIKRIQQIMVFAKPILSDVKLESEDEYSMPKESSSSD
ncbi:MAG: hypothetical protein GY866_40210 [Proteobacteria bacterium]|nr:hypothetical protein [Pseudomonadota bacterium]